nr:uncharacterized protein LOC105883561 isoform X2 [Microcebus murinus]
MAPPRGPPGSAIGSVGSGRERSAEPTRSRQAPRAPLPVVSGREAAASAPRLRGCRTRSSHACSRSVWLNHRNYLLESPHRFSVADLHQVCRVQDRLPPELPGRGEEGLPPLCPPAQVPGTERSHLIPTSRPHPRGQGTGRPVLPTPQPHLLWALSHNPCPPEPREGSEPRQGLASGTVTARPCTVER